MSIVAVVAVLLVPRDEMLARSCQMLNRSSGRSVACPTGQAAGGGRVA
jgi:hypothetical protein